MILGYQERFAEESHFPRDCLIEIRSLLKQHERSTVVAKVCLLIKMAKIYKIRHTFEQLCS